MKIKNIFNILLVLVSVTSYADSDAERFTALLDKAKVDRKAGHHKAAIKSLKKIYSKSSTLKNEALRTLVGVYIDVKKYDEAIDLLKEENSTNQFIGEYRMLLADVYVAADRYSLALAEIDSAEKILGPTSAVLRAKSVALIKLKMHAESVAALTGYLKLEPKDYVALVDRGEAHFVLKQYEQAFGDAAHAYQVRPFDERVLAFYAKSAFFNNNFVETKKIGRICNELFPKNEDCLEYLGKASYHKKEYSDAIKFFESYLKLNSVQPEVNFLYAEALAFNGNDLESDRQFSQTLKISPDYEMAMRSWAKFLNQRKKVDSLGVALKAFCSNNPANVWAAVELSKLLFLVGDQETGLDRMDALMSETKNDQGRFYNAYFLDQVGKYSRSRDYLEKIKDQSIDTHFHMGISYAKDKRFKEAIKQWSMIKNESPNYVKAQVNVALATEQLGQVVKAKELLSGIQAFAPTEYKTALEQKILSMGNEDRKPATDSQSEGINFFLEWSLPQL